MRGEIKVFVVDTEIGRYYLARYDQEGMIHETIRPIADNQMSAAVRKGNTALLSVINEGFQRITPEEIAQIKANWSGKKHQFLFDWREVRLYALIAFAVVVLVIVWNVQLRRKVARSIRDVEQRNNALLESERRFTQLFDSAPIPMAFAAETDGFCATVLTVTAGPISACGLTRMIAVGR